MKVVEALRSMLGRVKGDKASGFQMSTLKSWPCMTLKISTCARMQLTPGSVIR